MSKADHNVGEWYDVGVNQANLYNTLIKIGLIGLLDIQDHDLSQKLLDLCKQAEDQLNHLHDPLFRPGDPTNDRLTPL